MSAQTLISCPIVGSTPQFNIHLVPADMDIMKMSLDETMERQKNTFLIEGQSNPHVKIVAASEQALQER